MASSGHDGADLAEVARALQTQEKDSTIQESSKSASLAAAKYTLYTPSSARTPMGAGVL